ncbi:hypothetical protein pdul_cds_141 [Pandoravirus dulcis]|uniref:Uncharacterized protein n=1 Tax=Pandoravirus dulcis TaxID=1349409 RepID=S4VP59_9VIRU|nr:hypothetical protein pdul_cds_141 [Pandoravirus dulcis]AGO82063.1 hypothetical protein pdul_cds_141 [Pandoravirus dulcis]
MDCGAANAQNNAVSLSVRYIEQHTTPVRPPPSGNLKPESKKDTSMYRASLTTAARRGSHRLWRADLAHACANYPYYSSRGAAQTLAGARGPCVCKTPGSSESGASDPPQRTETIATVTECREAPLDAIFVFGMSATTAGMMLGYDANPVSGAIMGFSFSAMALSFWEISCAGRASITTRPTPPQ